MIPTEIHQKEFFKDRSNVTRNLFLERIIQLLVLLTERDKNRMSG